MKKTWHRGYARVTAATKRDVAEQETLALEKLGEADLGAAEYRFDPFFRELGARYR